MLLVQAKGIREFSQSQQSGQNALPHHCAAIIFWSFDSADSPLRGESAALRMTGQLLCDITFCPQDSDRRHLSPRN